MRFGRVGVSIHPRAHLSKVGEVVCRTRNQLFTRLRDGLAAVIRLHLRNFRHMSGDEFTQLAHQLGTLRCGRGRPAWEGGFGGCYGGVDFGFTARSDLCQHVLCSRVDGFKVVGTGNGLAVDEVVDLHISIPYLVSFL